MRSNAVTFSTIAALLTVAGVTPAVAQSNETEKLVDKVQTEAAWHGVEVERIRRQDQTLRVVGYDRLGREVTMTMDCASLKIACGTGSGVSGTSSAR